MPIQDDDDLTEEERALFGARATAENLALQCRLLKEMDVSVSAGVMDQIVIYLMTEFWDQGFSQTEIRAAFLAALGDMNRYAAGKERR
jgi:hypothetical protein